MPADPLRAVFSGEVISRLRDTAFPSKALRTRLDILTVTDEPAAPRLMWLRARKAAWEVYLRAAFACGLFTGYGADDLRNRLTGTDDDNFRSAIAECMACWVLAGKLKLQVTPRPAGRAGKVPDLAFRAGVAEIAVEVKAPFEAVPEAEVWFGDNSGLLASTVDEANRQFAKGRANVLCVVIDDDNHFFGSRGDLVRAFFGDDVLIITFNRQTLETVSTEVKFSPRGKFLKPWDKGEPRFTRIGAVVRIREEYVERAMEGGQAQPSIEPKWVVVHNPYCRVRIPTDIWGDCAQLVVDGDGMRWTDGKPVLTD